MDIKKVFSKNIPDVETKIQEFIVESVNLMKESNKDIFMVCKKDTLKSIEIDLLGLNGINKESLNALEQEGFKLIDLDKPSRSRKRERT